MIPIAAIELIAFQQAFTSSSVLIFGCVVMKDERSLRAFVPKSNRVSNGASLMNDHRAKASSYWSEKVIMQLTNRMNQ